MSTDVIFAGFVPGQHPIDAYGNGGFRFADMSHRGSILATPAGIQALDLAEGQAILPAHLAAMLAQAPGSIDLLLIGSGCDLQPVPDTLRWLLGEHGIRVEPMPTGAAARTYNVLVGEGRRVAALLMAVA